jgi:hypothetical protein
MVGEGYPDWCTGNLCLNEETRSLMLIGVKYSGLCARVSGYAGGRVPSFYQASCFGSAMKQYFTDTQNVIFITDRGTSEQ